MTFLPGCILDGVVECVLPDQCVISIRPWTSFHVPAASVTFLCAALQHLKSSSISLHVQLRYPFPRRHYTLTRQKGIKRQCHFWQLSCLEKCIWHFRCNIKHCLKREDLTSLSLTSSTTLSGRRTYPQACCWYIQVAFQPYLFSGVLYM